MNNMSVFHENEVNKIKRNDKITDTAYIKTYQMAFELIKKHQQERQPVYKS